MGIRFYVADSLTGKILTTLHPNAWQVDEPVNSPCTGSLAVPIPPDASARERLVDLTRQRVRWVAAFDDEDRCLFGGPIFPRPSRDEGNLSIPFVDWRAWFYHAYLRPAGEDRGDYVVYDTDDATIMTDLMAAALNTAGAPAIVVDRAPLTGNIRDFSANQLDRSIGDLLDSVTAQGGPEWWTYVTRSKTDPTVLVPHVRMQSPQRSSRETTIPVQWAQATGGNTIDFQWPSGSDTSTRVWATGAEAPPADVWASAENPDVADGVDIVWETIIGPLDNVDDPDACFDNAYTAMTADAGPQGQATFTLTADQLEPGGYAVGDRARMVFADGWTSSQADAVRIVHRTLSGGAREATEQVITLDLGDDGWPDDGSTPGEEVTDDGS